MALWSRVTVWLRPLARCPSPAGERFSSVLGVNLRSPWTTVRAAPSAALMVTHRSPSERVKGPPPLLYRRQPAGRRPGAGQGHGGGDTATLAAVRLRRLPDDPLGITADPASCCPPPAPRARRQCVPTSRLHRDAAAAAVGFTDVVRGDGDAACDAAGDATCWALVALVSAIPRCT
ncbi:MAG: hypothetical protein OXI08_09740 [Cyanobacteria bacterium MAG IRC4_bin_6]|nr:hypothetical protein [Cyanobacteria bacterium MAG IRC4_bin_6]